MNSLEEKIYRKWEPQWCWDNKNQPLTETLLVACTLYVCWNALVSRQYYKVNMTHCRATNLVYALPVSCALFENEREKIIGLRKGLFPRHRCNELFYKYVHGIWNTGPPESMSIAT